MPAGRAPAGGLAILPTWMIVANIRRGVLQVAFADCQFSPSALDSSVYAVFLYARHLSPKVRALVDFLVKRFTPRPSWELDGEAAIATEKPRLPV